MKKLLLLVAIPLVVFLFAGNALAQPFDRPDKPKKDKPGKEKPKKKQPKKRKGKSQLHKFIDEHKMKLKVLNKKLKELFMYIDELMEKRNGKEAKEMRIVAEAIELAIEVMRERIEGAKNEIRFREKLPPKVIRRIDELKNQIRKAHDKKQHERAEKLERELDEYLDDLRRKFGEKEEEIPLEKIMELLPNEVRKHLDNLKKNIERLREEGEKKNIEKIEKLERKFDRILNEWVEKLQSEGKLRPREHDDPGKINLDEVFELVPERVKKKIKELHAKIERLADEGVDENADRIHQLKSEVEEILLEWREKLIHQGKLKPHGEKFRKLSDDEIWEKIPEKERKYINKMKVKIKKAYDAGRLDEGEELLEQMEKRWNKLREKFGRVSVEPEHKEKNLEKFVWNKMNEKEKNSFKRLQNAIKKEKKQLISLMST